MAITLPVLGGTTLPQVERGGYTEELQLRGTDVVMASGAMATDLVVATGKLRFEMRWKGMTEAQVATIKTAWATVYTASQSFTSPLSGSYTVTRDVGALTLGVNWYGAGSTARADVSMKLREV
jgi:hypothetical protein